jgi:hypothetical protein
MHVIEQSHVTSISTVHVRRVDDFDSDVAADLKRFGEFRHDVSRRRGLHRCTMSHEVVLHIDYDHGRLLGIDYINLHDLLRWHCR